MAKTPLSGLNIKKYLKIKYRRLRIFEKDYAENSGYVIASLVQTFFWISASVVAGMWGFGLGYMVVVGLAIVPLFIPLLWHHHTKGPFYVNVDMTKVSDTPRELILKDRFNIDGKTKINIYIGLDELVPEAKFKYKVTDPFICYPHNDPPEWDLNTKDGREGKEGTVQNGSLESDPGCQLVLTIEPDIEYGESPPTRGKLILKDVLNGKKLKDVDLYPI